MENDPTSNRLIHEKSPYLLQHAHNPVDWFPWGDEAFSRAVEENKPIFLSIGYATCHWCHVMERETFMDPEVAQLMNDTFINVKVDREEHPEVDSIYMELAQALMSSAGGWPLNVVLTPDLKPFFAVTYLPPRASKGLIGMDQFATQIQMLWQSEERTVLTAQADKIVELFESSSKTTGEQLPGESDLENGIHVLFEIADPVYGGIKGEPKFPLGYQAEFFLQYSKENNDSRSLFYVELTLQMMARGGIYDHLGGGFARYCVDERWLVPHFEKMLYDNAILAKTYLEAYKYGKKPFFARICRETLDYTLRELKGDSGGFYSAEDADSDGQEGKFYTWSLEEIRETLTPELAESFCRHYDVREVGEFEGKNILHIKEDGDEDLVEARRILFEKRSQRTKPFKDDKVITSWNGLMIESLARAGKCFNEGRYSRAARETALWIKEHLYQEGALLRRFRDGDSRFEGGLDDHAFLIRALITLFEMGEGTEFLDWAVDLTNTLEAEFKSDDGAFYQSKERDTLLIRKCEFYDGAEPSGNAVHTENLLRLYHLTQEDRFLKQAEDVLRAAKAFIDAFPPGACYHLLNLQRYINKDAPLIVVALNEEQTHRKEIETALYTHFAPHAMTVMKPFGDNLIDAKLPSLATQGSIDGKTTVYICNMHSCGEPLTELDAILEAIDHQ